MIVFLYLIIIILISIIIFQYRLQKGTIKNLKYINIKLSAILSSDSQEKVLLQTEHKELRELLIKINVLLELKQKTLADYRKKEISIRKMLSNISHDLKTPLTVVLGYIETMKLNNDVNIEERELLLLKVHSKTLEVIDLINMFFDLAKLEAGDKDIPITRVNMNEICRKKILEFYDSLTSEGFQVEIDIPTLNIYAFANEGALDRIINNLISNAIKYGAAGKVIGLNLSCNEEFVFVEVWDKGKGIDEIYIDKVFERMYTLEDSRNKANGGSGLGLTITKRLVEKLGGEIFLKSKPFVKTSFTFKLKRLSY
ncbi:MAG: sensor histidine kinase [Clostridiaceae bacterium]|nr:sensor histidine kinase [Clostridiaceae bacterium]